MTRFARMIICGLLLTASASGNDWTQFLGPNFNNVCTEKNLFLDWPDSGPPQLWQIDCGEGYSAPVIKGTKLVLFDRIGNQEAIICLDTETQKPHWAYKYPTTYRDRYGYNSGPRSSPTIDDDRVYTYGAQNVLTCLNLADGALIWQRKLGEELDAPQNFFGNGLPAIVEGNTILINIGGTERGWILGIDKVTGETNWKTDTLGASYSAAVVAPFNGKRMAAFLVREGLRMVDPETGVQAGDLYPFRSRISDSVNGGSPVIIGNQIFLSAAYRTGAALVNFDGKNITEVWRNPEAMLNHWNTSIHHQGYIYGCSGRHSSNSTMRCIEAKTGKVMWDNENPKELARASMLLVNGDHFIVLGEYGKLALIKAMPEKYLVKKVVTAPLEYPAWAPPVVAHGRMYLRSENKLLCYDLRNRSE